VIYWQGISSVLSHPIQLDVQWTVASARIAALAAGFVVSW
jgi:hypothetical protein